MSKEDTARRRDIILRYLGKNDGRVWVGFDQIEAETLVTHRSLHTVLFWMENHDMVRLRATKADDIAQYQLTAHGRDIYNIRMEVNRPVEATA